MHNRNYACGKVFLQHEFQCSYHEGTHDYREAWPLSRRHTSVCVCVCTAPCLCRLPEAFRSLSRKQTSALSLSTVSAASYSQTRQQHVTLFSSHNAVRWRLSHEGVRFLLRQRQWHTAAPLMPVQDSCTVLYPRSGIRTNQSSRRTKTGTIFFAYGEQC